MTLTLLPCLKQYFGKALREISAQLVEQFKNDLNRYADVDTVANETPLKWIFFATS